MIIKWMLFRSGGFSLSLSDKSDKHLPPDLESKKCNIKKTDYNSINRFYKGHIYAKFLKLCTLLAWAGSPSKLETKTMFNHIAN